MHQKISIKDKEDPIKDPILASINKNLVDVRNISKNEVDNNMSDLSNMSNISNISNISNSSLLTSSSMYSIRKTERTELGKYVKNQISTYRSEIYYHISITTILSCLCYLIGTSIFYTWGFIVSMFFSIIYSVFLSIIMKNIIKNFRHSSKIGIQRFRDNCVALSYKNALLLQEYVDVYKFYIEADEEVLEDNKENNNDNNIIQKENVDLETRPNFVVLTPADITMIIKRIHNYIKISFDISSLKKSDNLSIQRGVIYCNLTDQSITNERNRKIESILNTLDAEKKEDIVRLWNSLDDKTIVSNTPYKWIMYEYRNLFRYLNSTNRLKSLYSVFSTDFVSYQQNIESISNSLKDMYVDKDETESKANPEDIMFFFRRLGDVLGIITDLFFAINISHFIFTEASVFLSTNYVVNIITILFLGGLSHMSVITALCSIRDIVRKKRVYDLDRKIDSIIKEMKHICC